MFYLYNASSFKRTLKNWNKKKSACVGAYTRAAYISIHIMMCEGLCLSGQFFIVFDGGNLCVTRFYFIFLFVFFEFCFDFAHFVHNYVSSSSHNSKLIYAYHFYLRRIVDAMQISNQWKTFLYFFSLSIYIILPIYFMSISIEHIATRCLQCLHEFTANIYCSVNRFRYYTFLSFFLSLFFYLCCCRHPPPLTFQLLLFLFFCCC